jgi:predicted kinase
VADVLILTGPHGSGKSSVAQALAERYDRVAHIPVDALRHFITPTGYVAPGKPGFERQHALAVRNACDLARNFLEDRIAVIVDDVVTSQADLDAYLAQLKETGVPVHCIRLSAPLDVCQARNRDRKQERQPSTRVEAVWRLFDAAGDLPGPTIENAGLTAHETADRVQALTTSGESIVWRPE